MTSRRSFLAAIAGAVTAQAIPQKSVQPVDELLEAAKRAFPQDAWLPFWIWENVELDGKGSHVEICPPPLPPEMVLTETAIAFDPATPYQQMADIWGSWELRMRLNHKDLVACPLRFLSYQPGCCMPFARGFRIQESDNLLVELAGQPFDSPAPVKIQSIFKGVVRL